MYQRTQNTQIQSQVAPKYLTISQMAAECNLGVTTTRRIAKESGSFRKFGKSTRVERDIFLSYCEKIGTPDSE